MTKKRTLLSSADFTLTIAVGLFGLILAVAFSGYLLSLSDMLIELYPDLRTHAIGSAINAAVALVIVMALKLYVTRRLRKSRTL